MVWAGRKQVVGGCQLASEGISGKVTAGFVLELVIKAKIP
jgi:hypothetical protein